jgi:dCMP deaminase
VGKSLIKEFPKLERDIRALSPESIVLEAQALNLAPDVRILEKNNIDELLAFDEVILPNDEVSRYLVDNYLKEKRVTLDTTFLRWHQMNAITNNPTNPDAIISSKDFDKKIIQLAQDEAEKSSDWWRHVGAVLVSEDRVILKGYNKHAVTENTAYIEGEPRSNFDAGPQIKDLHIFQHGEAAIISEAANKGISTKGLDLYITTFPCPTCAMLVANAGIKRVYYRDGYSLLDAERILKNAGAQLIQVK